MTSELEICLDIGRTITAACTASRTEVNRCTSAT